MIINSLSRRLSGELFNTKDEVRKMPAPVAPTSIDALPPAPSPADPVNFEVEADAYLGALPGFRTQANAAAQNVYGNATSAFDSATAAAASQVNAQAWATSLTVVSGGLYGARKYANDATTQATAAATSAATALNAPGTNATSATSLSVTAGSKAVVLQQTGKPFAVNMWVMVYRTSDPTKRFRGPITSTSNLVAGPSPTITVNATLITGSGGPFTDWTVIQIPEPVADIASQVEAEAGTAADKLMTPERTKQAILKIAPTVPHAIVELQQPSGTFGDLAGNGLVQIGLNTIERNVDSLVSLASNNITLPAGTYGIRGWVVLTGRPNGGAARVEIRNSTAGVVLAHGPRVSVADYEEVFLPVYRVVTLSATSVIQLMVRSTTATRVGTPYSGGDYEVYAGVEITLVG